jgi:hypothetical protein
MEKIMSEIENQPLPTRTCSNCACHYIQTNAANPIEKQMFCRRDPPQAAQMRGEVPRMRDGKAVIGRDGKPVMESMQTVVYLYKPTEGQLVCFDGWRTEGTLAGEKNIAGIPDAKLSEVIGKALETAMQLLGASVASASDKLLDS